MLQNKLDELIVDGLPVHCNHRIDFPDYIQTIISDDFNSFKDKSKSLEGELSGLILLYAIQVAKVSPLKLKRYFKHLYKVNNKVKLNTTNSLYINFLDELIDHMNKKFVKVEESAYEFVNHSPRVYNMDFDDENDTQN